MDHDIEQAADKAATDPVPAEALKAAELAYVRGEGLRGALAAAAPLIVADRATPAVVAALDEASHTIANLRAEVARLTAERDAAVEASRQGIAAAIEAGILGGTGPITTAAKKRDADIARRYGEVGK